MMRFRQLLWLLPLLLLVYPLRAQDGCQSEQEPNNEPAGAAVISGDCLNGRVGAADDAQDLWRWTVPASDGFWQLTLDGFDGGLVAAEIWRVEEGDAGQVLAANSLYRLSSRGETAVSLPLLLTPGDYFIGIAGDGGEGSYTLRLSRGDALPAPNDVEPNDRGDADLVSLDSAFRLSGNGDTDFFTWSLDEAASEMRWEVALQGPLGTRWDLVLQDPDGQEIVRRDSFRPLAGNRWVLHDLGLAAGDYTLIVRQQDNIAGAPYVLATRATGTRNGATPFEEEPNNLRQPYPLRDEISGRLTNDSYRGDPDVFRWTPDLEADRLFDIHLTTHTATERSLCLYTDFGEEMQCRSGSRHISLTGVKPVEDAYLLYINGDPEPDAEYTLTINAAGAVDPFREVEPNDRYWFAPPLPDAGGVQGRFDGRDTEIYRFVTEGAPQLWRVQATGSGLEYVAILDAGGRVVVEEFLSNGRFLRLSDVVLLPGPHFVSVRGTDGDYLLRLLSQGPPDPARESEPNDQINTAIPLPWGVVRRGVLFVRGDRDTYRFRLNAWEHIRLEANPPDDAQLVMELSGRPALRTTTPGEPLSLTDRLPPGDYTVQLRTGTPSDSAYDLVLERLNPFTFEVDPAQTTIPGLDVSLSMAVDEVAAYSPWAQSVAGTLTLTNDSDSTLALDVTAHSSDWRVALTPPLSPLTIPPGETTLSVQATLDPDLPADRPLWLTIQAAAAGGASVTVEATVTPGRTAVPVGVPDEAWFPVPETLRGAINVASPGLGATFVTADPRWLEKQPALHSSHWPDAGHLIMSETRYEVEAGITFEIDLAGDEAVPVTAVALLPQSPLHIFRLGEQAADFEIALSTDGVNYDTVLTAALSPLRQEQFFLLDEPVAARFARLHLLNNREDGGRIVLAEWKVLTVPDSVIASGRNIADPALGGHLVYGDWPGFQRLPDYTEPRSVLTEDPLDQQLSCFRECRPVSWVVAFHDQRTAQIERIEWVDSPAQTAEERFTSVDVYASDAGPTGPWQLLGTLDLTGAGPLRTLAQSEPVWVRYLRFELPVAADETYRQRPLPAVIRVFEQPSSADYRSILGEWGWQSSAGPREWLAPPRYSPFSSARDGDDTPSAATPLEDEPVSGWVQIGEDEDWYQFTAPAALNTAVFTLTGRPSVDVTLSLQDAAGQPVPIARDETASTPNRQVWRASVNGGEGYALRVHEPPRSILFVWDSSGSVHPFLPLIYQALGRFAAGVTPGEEVVNMLPFMGGLLLPEWEDEETLILRGLQEYAREFESSDTGEAMLDATEALAARTGSRAIILIGDIDLSDSVQTTLWPLLGAVQPHIYVMRVSQNGPYGESQMRNWAALNDGDARDAASVAELELAFDRAATRLRQPAFYELAAGFTFTEPPGPGSLLVTSELVERDGAPPVLLGDTAVELILDASGSMRQSLGNDTRIGVARTALIDLVNDVLPADSNVALRVFGNREGNLSCRTDLEVPLGPLDRQALTRFIEGIEPQEQANTALADSLRLVAEDLAEAAGRRLVILITDGEETCGGDPGAEIEALRAAGLDVRVNIVGFAIDDASLRAQFADWAALGGGEYIDAADAAALETAVADALRVPFRVLDQEGNVVAAGLVNGERLSLPAGLYTVEILTEPIRVLTDIVIVGDEATELLVTP